MPKCLIILAVLGILAGTSAVVSWDGQKVVFTEDQEGVGRLEGDMDRSEFNVKIITAPLRQIQALCLEAVGEIAPGCAKWDPGVCTIWIPEPIGMGDWTAFHIAGHEVWHCKIGDYHE